MKITLALPSEAGALSEIAFAAKSHWGYPSHWMTQWRPVLTVTPASVIDHETYVAREEEHIMGFSAFTREGRGLRLEHLWVRPDEMGRGVGRALFRHAQRRAHEMGFETFEIESDPNAAGFYERMGTERIGTRITTLDDTPRELPVFRCKTRPEPDDGG